MDMTQSTRPVSSRPSQSLFHVFCSQDFLNYGAQLVYFNTIEALYNEPTMR